MGAHRSTFGVANMIVYSTDSKWDVSFESDFHIPSALSVTSVSNDWSSSSGSDDSKLVWMRAIVFMRAWFFVLMLGRII